MSDQSQSPEAGGESAPSGLSAAPPVSSPPAPAPPPRPLPERPEYETAASGSERPEVALGGAFAGGLVLALILKRLAAR